MEVVESRLNALAPYPLAIRAGKRAGDRNLRAEMLQLLSHVLTGTVLERDRSVEREAQAQLEEFEHRRNAVWHRVEELRTARNRVDQLDQLIEAARRRLPDEFWQNVAGIGEPPSLADTEQALQIVEDHLAPHGSLWERLCKFFRRRREFRNVEQLVSPLAQHHEVRGQLPQGKISLSGLPSWRDSLRLMADRLQATYQVGEYWQAFEALKQLFALEHLADELAEIEEQLNYWSARSVEAYTRLLPDRLKGETRQALSDYRATVQRLAEDQVGGQVYANLARQQERLFSLVSKALPVWCVTNLAARGSIPFDSGLFDLVVIDEASQCDIPSAVPLLYRARRVMVIGDGNQLRHIATLPVHRDQQLQEQYGVSLEQAFTYENHSLFDLGVRNAGDGMITLREHFRSHSQIISFSNHQWYGDVLEVCTDYRRLNCPNRCAPGICWTEVRGHVIRPTEGGAMNQIEADAIVNQIELLLVRDGFTGTVGVVTPFRAQAELIRALISRRLSESIRQRLNGSVAPAHGFQGDERDVILFSPCVGGEMPRGAKRFLESTDNLLNVAITRARALLHVVGDMDACLNCGIPHLVRFAAYVRDSGKGPEAFGDGDPSVGFLERPFQEKLEAAGLKPMPQYSEDQYSLDLAIIEGEFRLDIEIDGELFHREWDGSRCRSDLKRDRRLRERGWVIKRFWAYRIRDEMDVCAQEVVDLIRGPRK